MPNQRPLCRTAAMTRLNPCRVSVDAGTMSENDLFWKADHSNMGNRPPPAGMALIFPQHREMKGRQARLRTFRLLIQPRRGRGKTMNLRNADGRWMDAVGHIEAMKNVGCKNLRTGPPGA